MVSIIPVMVTLILIILPLIISYKKKFGLTLSFLISNFAIIFIYNLYKDLIDVYLAFSPVYLYSYPEKIYTIVTTMFLHADFSHIFGNMLTLFFLGVPFERKVGWKKFAIIYFLSGICGSIAYSVINPEPVILIGASGAIFGILGAFAFSYPFDEIVIPLPVGFVAFITKIRVIYAALFFGLIEVIFSLFSYGYDNVAHAAHVGGLVSGMILSRIFIKENKRIGKKIDILEYRSLSDLSINNELIERVKLETIPEVKREWMGEIIKKSKCPYCGEKLKIYRDEIFCKKCKVVFK